MNIILNQKNQERVTSLNRKLRLISSNLAFLFELKPKVKPKKNYILLNNGIRAQVMIQKGSEDQ